ncbi:MAG: zinc ribbon domain-containing protein [Actinobacteria bacterium]|nr:MAG: zinc ribbon domain-containing protein [Actinomycetota bacterium]
MKNCSSKKTSLISVVLIAIIAPLFLFSFVSIAFGEGANFKKLEVMIKPEYDVEKQVFLRFDGELDKTSMPAETFFYSPKDLIEDSTLNICAFNASNQMLCQTREKSIEGNYKKFKVPMPEKKFMFEGYFESIKDNNGQRTLEYTFKAAQDIKNLDISISQPKGASNFKVQPAGQASGKDEHGLQNSIYSFSNVKEGKEIKFNISYSKNDWNVSVEKADQASPESNETTTNLPGSAIFLAILGAIILTGGILFAFLMPSRKRARRPTAVAPKGKARFCTNCGTRLAEGAKFCANCGSKIEQ